MGIFPKFCQAQLQLDSSVNVQLRTEISIIISVRPHPTLPEQVYLSHFQVTSEAEIWLTPMNLKIVSTDQPRRGAIAYPRPLRYLLSCVYQLPGGAFSLSWQQKNSPPDSTSSMCRVNPAQGLKSRRVVITRKLWLYVKNWWKIPSRTRYDVSKWTWIT